MITNEHVNGAICQCMSEQVGDNDYLVYNLD